VGLSQVADFRLRLAHGAVGVKSGCRVRDEKNIHRGDAETRRKKESQNRRALRGGLRIGASAQDATNRVLTTEPRRRLTSAFIEQRKLWRRHGSRVIFESASRPRRRALASGCRLRSLGVALAPNPPARRWSDSGGKLIPSGGKLWSISVLVPLCPSQSMTSVAAIYCLVASEPEKAKLDPAGECV
jgi:hypothetical protein